MYHFRAQNSRFHCRYPSPICDIKSLCKSFKQTWTATFLRNFLPELSAISLYHTTDISPQPVYSKRALYVRYRAIAFLLSHANSRAGNCCRPTVLNPFVLTALLRYSSFSQHSRMRRENQTLYPTNTHFSVL